MLTGTSLSCKLSDWVGMEEEEGRWVRVLDEASLHEKKEGRKTHTKKTEIFAWLQEYFKESWKEKYENLGKNVCIIYR